MRGLSLMVLALAAGVASGVFGVEKARATPAGGLTAFDRSDAAAGLDLSHKVHGCHRFAQDSLDGWHRHVGPYCRWVPSARSYQNPYARCRTRCQYIGPIKQCYQVCR